MNLRLSIAAAIFWAIPILAIAQSPRGPVAPASFRATDLPESLPPPLEKPAGGAHGGPAYPIPPGWPSADDLYRQTDDDVRRKSWGCVNCHHGVHDMHALPTVKLGCIDCHGGDADCPTKEGG